MLTKRRLAFDAIHLEQNVMKENVGSQDQVLAAFGGFNLINFGDRCNVEVKPVILNIRRLKLFQKHLMLFFTGFSRIASNIAAEQVKNTLLKGKELKAIYDMVPQALDILNSKEDIAAFGKLLDEGWRIKRGLTNRISNSYIDEIYENALSAGALGGKLLGAGGGGFMLIFARPEAQEKIRQRLKRLLWVPFNFENLGSQVIFYSPNDLYR